MVDAILSSHGVSTANRITSLKHLSDYLAQHAEESSAIERTRFVRDPGDIMAEAGATFRTRNAKYKSNYLMVGEVMHVLFPNGVHLTTADDFTKWHLIELLVVKLTRFAVSGTTHQDSIRDMQVYAAMIESLLPLSPETSE